ncbi:MAG: rhombosortase [Granulosicoccaceae bacterium]
MASALQQYLRSPALWLAIGIAVLCVVLQFSGLEPTLRFDRQAIAKGHWWLLLSGNFVHLSVSHLGMNMAGLALIVALVWTQFNAWQWLLIILFSSVCVGLGLYFFDGQVDWYVGFSGTLHGLIIAGSLADLKRYPRSAAALLIMVSAKLVWEQLAGPLPGSESVAGGSVVVNAHLYGAIAGLVIGVAVLAIRYRRADPANT